MSFVDPYKYSILRIVDNYFYDRCLMVKPNNQDTWHLKVRTLKSKGISIINTLKYIIIVQMMQLYHVNWSGKSGHLNNQDTYDWFQVVHNIATGFIVS